MPVLLIASYLRKAGARFLVAAFFLGAGSMDVALCLEAAHLSPRSPSSASLQKKGSLQPQQPAEAVITAFDSRAAMESWWRGRCQEVRYRLFFAGIPSASQAPFLRRWVQEGSKIRLQLMIPRQHSKWAQVYRRFRDWQVPVSSFKGRPGFAQSPPAGGEWLFSAVVDRRRYDAWQGRGSSGAWRYFLRTASATPGEDWTVSWQRKQAEKVAAHPEASYSKSLESVYTYTIAPAPKPEDIPARLPQNVKWRKPALRE